MHNRGTGYPLGGGQSLHRHVARASNDHVTVRKVKEIRNTLLTSRKSFVSHVTKPNRQTGSRRFGRQTTEMSGNGDSALFRNAPFGVNRKKLGYSNSRSRSQIEALRATKCNRWQFDSELAHACDVLGPNTCSDCIRERMRMQICDDADRTFPGISVSERDLCTDKGTLAKLQVRSSNRLPPISESGYIGYKASGLMSRTTNVRDSKTLQDMRRRAAKNGLLPITSTELQNRVLRRHLVGKQESPPRTGFREFYSPPLGVRDDTDITLAPTPTISVEIKFPTIKHNRDISGSKLSPW
ncbi:hypothetical protein LSH36_647g01002 [Paralvinella palmiformis]|uniref:Uncharacterized protein n=1 Tax=Paralvinella palmiformis TaxID=53620 RepID=A0AAD9MUH4_9ANNE|nr:hypothetical protein LSH36_647g01002 [Paralvinella palmiformis]